MILLLTEKKSSIQWYNLEVIVWCRGCHNAETGEEQSWETGGREAFTPTPYHSDVE